MCESAEDASARKLRIRSGVAVIASISGLEELVERDGDEAAFAELGAAIGTACQVAESMGGSVDEAHDDWVLATFGLAPALDNVLRSALNAALAMRLRIEEHARRLELPEGFALKIGIASGTLMDARSEHRSSPGVMGETLKRAAALKDLATAGQILVDSEVYSHAPGQFSFRASGDRSAADTELIAYQLVTPAPLPARSEAPAGLWSPLAGREHELERLRRSFTRVRGGQGSVLAVVGEAGIGKSRLLSEVLHEQDDGAVQILFARAREMGRALSFHPFGELVRGWARIDESRSGHDAIADLWRALKSLLGADADEVTPFLGDLIGVRETVRDRGVRGEVRQRVLRRSVDLFVRRIAARTPLVLVFEDLHWADGSSLDLLASLLPLVHEHPVLFVYAMRPQPPQAGHATLREACEGLGSLFAEVIVGPLALADSRRLIESLCAESPISGPQELRIAQASGGNPFFIEEVVRSLRHPGAGAGETLEAVPHAIRDVLMVRIDELPERSRSLVQRMSVMGERVPLELLTAFVEESDDGWELDIARLIEAGLLTRDDHSCSFRHALTREVVYGSILPSQLARWHRRAAEVIESRIGAGWPDAAAMLAYHFGRCGDTERAEHWLVLAGKDAALRGATNEALAFFREARRLYEDLHGPDADPERAAELRECLAQALLDRGHFEEAIREFSGALSLLEAPPRAGRVARLVRLATSLIVLTAHVYLARDRARPRATDRDRSRIRIRDHRAKAQALVDPARFVEDAIEAIRLMLRLDPSSVPGMGGHYAQAAGILAYAGISTATGGRWLAKAEKLCDSEDADEVFVTEFFGFLHDHLSGEWSERRGKPLEYIIRRARAGQIWEAANFLEMMGAERAHQGRFAEAWQCIDHLKWIDETYGFDLARSGWQSVEAVIELERGALDRAKELLEAWSSEHADDLPTANLLGELAKAQVCGGDLDGAAQSIGAVHTILSRFRTVPPYQRGAYLRSRLLFDLARLERVRATGDRREEREAARRARRSEKAARRNVTRSALQRVEVYRLVARRRWLVAPGARAIRWWQRALSEAERMGCRPELGRIHLELSERLGEASLRVAGLDAEAHFERGRTVFESLGLELPTARDR